MPNYSSNGNNQNSGNKYQYNNSFTTNNGRGGIPYTPGQPPQKKNPAGYHVPTWLIVLGFFIAVPLGLALLVARMCEGSIGSVKYNAPPQYTGTPHRTSTSRNAAAAPPPYQATAQPAPPAGPAKPKKEPFNWGKLLPGILTGLGVFTLAVGAINIMDVLQYALPYGIQSYDVSQLISNGAWCLSGLGMMFGAGRMRLGQRIRNKIKAIVGDAKNMPIDEVAEALPATPQKTQKYLQQCIDRGQFGPQAYLDMRSASLVVSGPAPERPEDEEKEEEKPISQTEPARAGSKYDEILRQLRQVNDAIPGEQMTAKIDRLENVTAKIFKLVQEKPEKLPQMRKFMDYYLPTSLKLLNNYAQLDAQGVEGENISEAKREIENTMDTLVSAFERQLDKLFYMDSIDISADITTMQNMLAADGLTQGVFEAPAAPQPPKL